MGFSTTIPVYGYCNSSKSNFESPQPKVIESLQHSDQQSKCANKDHTESFQMVNPQWSTKHWFAFFSNKGKQADLHVNIRKLQGRLAFVPQTYTLIIHKRTTSSIRSYMARKFQNILLQFSSRVLGHFWPIRFTDIVKDVSAHSLLEWRFSRYFMEKKPIFTNR